jgi:hypothetical protein
MPIIAHHVATSECSYNNIMKAQIIQMRGASDFGRGV